MSAKRQLLSQHTLHTIDFSDPQDAALHDQVGGPRREDAGPAQETETNEGHEKTLHLRQIEAINKQIDALVRELRGLTEDEIKIVEEATA